MQSKPFFWHVSVRPASEEFEKFVGYAQRRFFDESTAIAMALSAQRLLALLLEMPAAVLHTVWPRHDRAEAVGAGRLLVDHDFCLTGRNHTWRLRADHGERHARTWALKLLDDCNAYVLRDLSRPVPDFLPRHEDRPALDPQLAGRITAHLGGGRRENDMAFRHSRQQRVSITRQRHRPGRRACATDAQMTRFN
ncbi:hypothetical protein ACWDA7_47830 [Streptomyces sp. NPDC001156]